MAATTTADTAAHTAERWDFLTHGTLFAVLPEEARPTWPEWEAAVGEHRARMVA